MADLTDTWLDGLANSSAKHAHVLPPGTDTRDVLAYFARRLSESPTPGFVISRAAIPISNTVIVRVSPALLALLGYATDDDYRTAVAAPGFVHDDDLEVVEHHIRHRVSTPYDARLRRADLSYRRLRLQGATILEGSAEYRFSLFWDP